MPYLAGDTRGRYSQLLEKRDYEWKLYYASLEPPPDVCVMSNVFY